MRDDPTIGHVWTRSARRRERGCARARKAASSLVALVLLVAALLALAAPAVAAPTTTDDTNPEFVWFNHDVTVHFSAIDNGQGIDYTEYSLDSGATWTRGTEVTVVADPLGHTADGQHKILYRSADLIGGLEATRTCWARIDTQGAATTPLARASVRRGRIATLTYRIDEVPFPCGPTATVTIRIKNGRGRVVQKLSLGLQTVNMDLAATFRCRLPVGRYRYWIFAIDNALNPQAKIGRGYLRVR